MDNTNADRVADGTLATLNLLGPRSRYLFSGAFILLQSSTTPHGQTASLGLWIRPAVLPNHFALKMFASDTAHRLRIWISGLIVYVVDALSQVLSRLRPTIHQAGRFDLGKRQATDFPQYKGLKCYVVLQGRCWLTLQGHESISLTEGDCFLLTHGEAFCLESELNSPKLKLAELVRAMQAGLPGLYKGPPACTMAGGHFDFENDAFDLLTDFLPSRIVLPRDSRAMPMRHSLERMRDELLGQQLGGSFLVQQLAYLILVDALRGHLSSAGPRAVGWLYAMSDDRIRPALTAIQESPGRPWTLDSLAQHIGMSRALFAKRFREKVGETPIDYLTRWRMAQASEQLTSTDKPVLEIALSLGYENESSFGKAYKRVTGSSPRQHRYGRAARE